MILILKGADFSSHNIGTLDTYFIQFSPNSGIANHNVPTSIKKNTSLSATITIKEGYELGSAGVSVKMGGTTITSGVTVNGNTITISIASVTGNVTISVPTVNTSTGEEGEPEIPDNPPSSENIAYYVINKNIWSDGEITDSSGTGRIAITTYFPTNGKELSVSSSIATTTIAKRYYDSNKVGGAAATGSAYGRVALVVNTTGTALVDNYAGETLTVNGTTYTLQPDLENYGPQKVAYVTKANIGADGALVENYSEFRVAILDYFETNGKALTAACSLGNAAYRYYNADKVGGVTSATESTYGRIVLYSIATENQNDAAVEGTALTVNGKSYILSNN